MKRRSLILVLLVIALLIPCTIAAAGYHYVGGTDWVKVRKLPYDNATVLDNYRKDFAITSYKKYNDRWAYIHFSDGREGYVLSKFCKSASARYYAYIVPSTVDLKKGPADKFTTAAKLSKGTKVTVLTHGSVWSYVSSSTKKGYVRNSVLSKSAVKPPKGGYTAYVVNSNNKKVNIRRGAGKGFASVKTVSPGTAVTVLEHGTKWDKVKYNGVTGWMMNDYLSKTKPKLPSEAPAPKPTAKPLPPVPYTAYTTAAKGKTVNLRHGPGMLYAPKVQVPLGKAVTVLAHYDGTWAKVKYKGIVGYMKKQYLTKAAP